MPGFGGRVFLGFSCYIPALSQGFFLWEAGERVGIKGLIMPTLMKSLSCTLILLLAGIVGLAAAEISKPIKFKQLPAAVQKTVKAQVSGGRLANIDKVIEDGETRYDVELDKDGVERSLSVAPAGRLISWQMFVSELPGTVRKTIQAQVGEGKLGEIDKTFEDGSFTYDVELTKNGVARSFTVGTDGKLLAAQVLLAETPEAVQKAIRTKVENGTVTRIDKNTEEEKIAYDVEAQKGGRKVSFSVDPDGNLTDTAD